MSGVEGWITPDSAKERESVGVGRGVGGVGGGIRVVIEALSRKMLFYSLSYYSDRFRRAGVLICTIGVSRVSLGRRSIGW